MYTLYAHARAAPVDDDGSGGGCAVVSRRPFSALDLYIAVMTRWRPRRAWFAAHAPKLHGIALAAERVPEIAGVWRRNFPE
jgi:GST-like protein